MELIIIKGESDAGKTTTAALLHNELIEHYEAELQWMILDDGKLPLCEEDLVPDFRVVLKYKGNTIGIVSHGDTSRYLKGFINEMTRSNDIDILIICANTKEYIWNMLDKKFGEVIKTGNIFELTNEYWSVETKNKLSVKRPIVNEIINHINQISIKK